MWSNKEFNSYMKQLNDVGVDLINRHIIDKMAIKLKVIDMIYNIKKYDNLTNKENKINK